MRLIKQIYNILLPATCIVCKHPSNRELDLCFSCEKKLPFMHSSCRRCAETLPPSSIQNLICGECLKYPPPFNEIKSLFRYDNPIDHWITQTKFHENLVYARTLGLLMTNHFANINHDFDCIVPIPLHYARLKQRGFNQALEIARPISKKLNIPLQFRHCHRIKETNAQSQLKFDERSLNIKKAFFIDKKFSAKKVLVIDDVMTTGNTIREFCKTLKEHGVEYIAVWVCARTVLR